MAQPKVARATTNQRIGPDHPDLMAPILSSFPSGDSGPDSASDTIIRSKVQAPVVRDSTLARGRLLGWLDEYAAERIRVLAAEAGYGKTTLLADWARRTDRTVRWLKLDPPDAEWTTFLSYLVAAFQEGDPKFGLATRRLLSHVATLGPSPDQVTSQFLGELGHAITEPTVLVIDDLQHLDGNEEVLRIIERLTERAPESLTFILSGRHRPDLRLGRLTAQGKVITLDTDDLRFTNQETGDLFSSAYRMPLDGDLVNAVDARTEGWGASLQLLYSSIRSQRPAEVREFIRGLAGSQEPLYDFLAEEVLGRQTPLMQRVLVHAAILDRIVPALVVAALAATPDAPSPDAVIDALEVADDLGLMSRNAPRSTSRRFHPLLREFLSSHLRLTFAPDTLKLMHFNVAEAAEAIHWPTSAHHYIEAGDGLRAMQVVSDATIEALGSGTWGAALDLVARIPDVEPSVSVQAIRARALVGRGDALAALTLLERVRPSDITGGRDRAVHRLALASALNETERHRETRDVLRDVVEDHEAPDFLVTVAAAWFGMHASEDLSETCESLRVLAVEAEREGLPWFAAVASHNRAIYLLAQGKYEACLEDGRKAIRLFQETADDLGHTASTRLSMAQALFELGDFESCFEQIRLAQSTKGALPDAFAEAATLFAWAGMEQPAQASLVRAQQTLADRTNPPITADAVGIADFVVKLATGGIEAAGSIDGISAAGYDQNQAGLVLLCRAIVAALGGGTAVQVETAIEQALHDAQCMGARRWAPQLRLVRAMVASDAQGLMALLSEGSAISESSLLTLADVIGSRLVQLDGVPAVLDRHCRKWASRWRPVLRQAVRNGPPGGGTAAARLLSEIGEDQDVSLLRRWERSRRRESRDLGLSVALARRVSPTLRILDLGRAGISVGPRQVKITEVRRRAASLLLYLVSRPKQTATREQVFEALWPNLDVDQAANSLHQTLYFLRRELAADSSGSKPLVEYVPVESELVYLEPDLVQIDSVSFVRQASDLRGREQTSPSAISLLHSYQGQFAPEFEYEEWAIQWRDQVHSTFLDLTEQAARARMSEEHAPEAAAILRHALAVDPQASELKPLMAAALHLSGSAAAARQLYDQIAEEHRREFAEPAPSFVDLLADAQRRLPRTSKGGH